MKNIMNEISLKELTEKYKNEYKTNEPYSHVRIKDIFPNEILNDMYENVLKNKDTYRWSKLCTTGNDFSMFGESIQRMMNYLVSDEWVEFLSNLTEIKNLHSDPSWYASGINYERRGSHLEPHTDFNYRKDLCGSGVSWRRVNILLFLSSENWQNDWGGHAECGKLVKNDYVRVRKYKPQRNSLVVFETFDGSYHGFDLVRCPKDKGRIVITAYYYTLEQGSHSRILTTTNYVGWDIERRANLDYFGRIGTGWKELSE